MAGWLGYINIGLALFNLIPGFPLDGGRILRAIVWWKTGDAGRSTTLAARVGQVAALIFIATGLSEAFSDRGGGFSGLWLALIGLSLLEQAGESRRRANREAGPTAEGRGHRRP